MTLPKLQTFGDSVAARKVIAQAIDYADGTHEIAHVHHRAQLVYATSGIVRAVTPDGLWMLSPGNGLLIGSMVEHELYMVGSVSMRTLYIEPNAIEPNAIEPNAIAPHAVAPNATGSGAAAPELVAPAMRASQRHGCRVIAVNDLLRATILSMFDTRSAAEVKTDAVAEDAADSRTALIVPLILHLLQTAPDDGNDARLPLPASPRLRRICESLITDPANNDTLERWAERIGASSRTVARLFRQETGMTFGQWREQLRLAEAMSKLSVGHRPAQVAVDLGYVDVRTFGAMFQRVFGVTPQQFQKRRMS